MKKQPLRFILYTIIIYLTCGVLNPAIAASQPSGRSGTHFCGVTDSQPNKRYSDQFPNRRYARSFAANVNVGEPRTVRMIYFLPNDRPYRAEAVQKMKDDMLIVQTFYAEQMEAHGYGKITFRFETDSQGEPMVHRVDGQYPSSHYRSSGGLYGEIEQAGFNFNTNVCYIYDGGVNTTGGAFGMRRGKTGGFFLMTDVGYGWRIVAHELGHAFGLHHDFRDGTYIMSYGPGWNRLSACAAEFLAVHPYFNPNIPIEEEQSPTIELISPRTYPAGSKSVSIQLNVSDSEGLHQVFLFVTTRQPHPGAPFLEVKTCRALEGKEDTVVGFDYDGVIPSDGSTSLSNPIAHLIHVEAVDTEGNISSVSFGLTEFVPHHIDTLEGHVGPVNSVAFSSDGKILATGGEDRTVKLWDVTTKQNITTLEHRDTVFSVVFSHDGTTLASGAGSTAELWDIATETSIATLEGHGNTVFSVAFSSDEVTLATGSWDGTVKLWNVTTRANFATLEGHAGPVDSVAFSSDEVTLAAGSWDASVKLWDVATQQNIATLEHASRVGYTFRVPSVSFSPDGAILATGTEEGTLKLWDIVTETSIVTVEGHTNFVNSVVFSPDEITLATGSWDGTVKLWDIPTGANFATLGQRDRVFSVVFSPDEITLAAGLEDGTVTLWDTSGWMEVRLEVTAEIDLPDPNLRAAVATALGKLSSAPIVRGNMATLTRLNARNANISDLTGLEGATNLRTLNLGNNSVSNISSVSGLTNLTVLSLWVNNISDISPVAELTKLTVLDLGINNISDISAVSGLTNLQWLGLRGNNISDISPLAANTGLGNGDTVDVQGNPLSYLSIHTHIPTLQSRGVTVELDNQAYPALLKISGDNQKGASFGSLSQPFVVEALDANGSVLGGISVTFAVTGGGGTLSATNTTTDAHGKVQSTLTLGPNLGTNTVEVSAAGIQGTAIFHAISDTEAPPIMADVNGDGSVNVLDLIVVASELGNTGTNLVVDVNGDGVVSILDLVLAAGMFEGAAAAPSAQPQVPETLTAVEVQGWLTDARALEVRNSIMKRGFLVLEQLLVSLIPTEMELLHNYPNPFNPETWIPYRLAEDAFVTLTIYDGNGWVVRTFDVGHRIAAAYENRSKAIYWNGKNGLGESVASGVYFYTLTAGDYSATRKMLVLK